MMEAQFLAPLREVFELCDCERRGYISIDQLQDLCRKYFGGREEDMVQLVQNLDPNGMGYITFPDFCSGVLRLQGFDEVDTVMTKTPRLLIGSPSSGDLVMSEDDPTLIRSDDAGLDQADTAIVGSADNSRASSEFEHSGNSPCLSDGEERFECYGEGDIDFEVNGHLDPNIAKPSLSSDSFCSNSSTGSTTSGRVKTPFQQRNTWLRTSLRRQSGSSKRLSSNALASQLFRNGAPNGQPSSRRSSLSCDSDEMYTDQISLEEDVLDLNQKVHQLQQQVSVLSENQNNNEDRYSKVKTENAVLMARIHSLEEQIRELEIRSEERLVEEERRLKDSMARQEREKNQEIEHFTTRLYNLQQEHLEVKAELMKLRSYAERLKEEKHELHEQLSDSLSELTTLKEEHKKVQELSRRERDEFVIERNNSAQMLNELTREVEDLRRRRRSDSSQEMPGVVVTRCHDLENELRQLRDENRALREANEELQAQLLNAGLTEGRNLLHHGTASLAEEFETLSKDQITEALREQQDVNAKLRAYIDGILLNIVENYPQLLEVKTLTK